MKLLAIQFKFLGDLLVALPALRALQAHTGAELHLAVAAEAAPLVATAGLDWVHRVWAIPRRRGKMSLRVMLPLIGALRRERFDRSVDLVGNDRGAILSRLVSARERLGPRPNGGFVGRSWCYTHTEEELDPNRHETVRHFALLGAWGVPWAGDASALPVRLRPTAEALATVAGQLPPGAVAAHLSTSQLKKEWPVARWAELHQIAESQGVRLVFTSGPSPREQALLDALASLAPGVRCRRLPGGLPEFAAYLAGARAFVCGDTAPLHLAAGLGVPTIGLFGPTDPARWAPLGPGHLALRGGLCPCSGHLHVCPRDPAACCIGQISPMAVWHALAQTLAGL